MSVMRVTKYYQVKQPESLLNLWRLYIVAKNLDKTFYSNNHEPFKLFDACDSDLKVNFPISKAVMIKVSKDHPGI